MRTVLAASSLEGWNVRALSFKQVYLYVPLSEEIWLDLPSEDVVQACKVVYGLQQSATKGWKELRKSTGSAG